ncbi:hypothetical protein EMCRGX_G009688 [Ephydatia muelleri]
MGAILGRVGVYLCQPGTQRHARIQNTEGVTTTNKYLQADQWRWVPFLVGVYLRQPGTQPHARIQNAGGVTTTNKYLQADQWRWVPFFGDGCHSCELQSTLGQTLSCSIYPQVEGRCVPAPTVDLSSCNNLNTGPTKDVTTTDHPVQLYFYGSYFVMPPIRRKHNFEPGALVKYIADTGETPPKDASCNGPSGYCDGVDEGPSDGVDEGPSDGVDEGPSGGVNDSVNEGPSDGVDERPSDGVDDGFSDGVDQGPSDGVDEGPSDGVDEGPSDGVDDGSSDGVNEGPCDGVDEGSSDGVDEGLVMDLVMLDKDTDASFQDGSDKEDDDTQVHVESDSRSVDDTDLAAGAILVPDFKNNPDQDDIFATPWEKEHYLKYFPRQTRPSDRCYAIMMS